MASSLGSPEPLRGKLSQVKNLLDNANKRLQDNYEIFTTKASASGSSSMQLDNDQNVTLGLKRTMNDISTLRSVLNCPIFNQIVDVTDSLDKLSYQLNMHPSIGPSDYNIDANGELILAPPFEANYMNAVIDSKPSEYTNHANPSTHATSFNLVQNNTDQAILNDHQNRFRHHHQQQQSGYNIGNTNTIGDNGFTHVLQEQTNMANRQPFVNQNVIQNMQKYTPPNRNVSSPNSYDNEKLVANGASKTFVNVNKQKGHNLAKSESIGNQNDGENQRHKSDPRLSLDQGSAGGNYVNGADFQSSLSMNQVNERQDPARNGYSNEMYELSHTYELNQIKPTKYAMDHQQAQSKVINYDPFVKNSPTQNIATNGKVQSSQATAVLGNNRSSCSPSTSAGSTVRLADECDSGASSYLSNNAKNGTPCSPYPYKPNEQTFDNPASAASSNREKVADSSIDQEIIDDLPPDMERIKVTLEKDEKDGLGITVAGYTFEKEEISGIFIKSILPNSPAERSGKIRALDQIFAVNGRALLGYNNTDAVRELKQTPKSVTLELVRYLDGSRYQKLQAILAKVQKDSNLSNHHSSKNACVPSQDNVCVQSLENAIVNTQKSSIPVSVKQERFYSTGKSDSLGKQSSVQNSPINQPSINENPSSESIYKNDHASQERSCPTSPFQSAKQRFSNDQTGNLSPRQKVQSQIPVAAQRGGTNKVIETKQGARNTIDIRSPVCQNTTATYVNKIADIDFGESVQTRIATLLSQNNDSNEFCRLIRTNEPEWEKDAEIIEIYKDTSQGLGFTIKDYNNPRDPNHSIIMVTSLTPGGIAEKDGRLSSGDLLIFVDDTNLEGASMDEAVKALKKTNGQVRLGVLKLKRSAQD